MSQDIFELIEEQTQSNDPNTIEELVLDKSKIGKFTEEIKKKLESFPNLTSLSLNECEITSLENFPKLPKLIRVELIDNKITGQQLKHLLHLSELQSLSLGGNLIKNLKEIDVLQQLPKLFQLDFLNNDVAQDPEYREYVFSTLKGLGILDNYDSKGQEVQYDDEDDEDVDDQDDEDDDEDEEEDDEDEDDDEEGVNQSEDSEDDDELNEEGEEEFDEGADDDDDAEEDDDDDDAEAIEQKSTQKKKVKPN
ncbi:hypothetical protein ABPG72_018721 [Tetrahymena utriculariae]